MTQDIKQKMNSISLGNDEFNEYQLERFAAKTGADLVIYDYNIGDWSGSGLAVWRVGGLWGYGSLSHCSCNGPLDDLNSIMYTLDEVRQMSSMKSERKVLNMAESLS